MYTHDDGSMEIVEFDAGGDAIQHTYAQPAAIETAETERAETMPVCMSKTEGRIYFALRAEGEGGIIGDLFRDIGPGESAFGRSYDEWAALPAGAFKIDGGA